MRRDPSGKTRSSGKKWPEVLAGRVPPLTQTTIFFIVCLALIGATVLGWLYFREGRETPPSGPTLTAIGAGNTQVVGTTVNINPDSPEVAAEKVRLLEIERNRVIEKNRLEAERRLQRCDQYFKEAMELLYPESRSDRPVREPANLPEDSVRVNGMPLLTTDQSLIKRAREKVQLARDECPDDWRVHFVEATAIRAEGDLIRSQGSVTQDMFTFKNRVFSIYKNGIRLLELEINKPSSHPWLRRKLAELCLQAASQSSVDNQSLAQKAIDNISALDENDRHDPAVFANMAQALAIRRRPSEAIEYSTKALALEPNLFETRVGIAILHAELGEPDKAETALKTVATELKRQGGDVYIFAIQASIHNQRRQFDEALKCIDKCHSSGFTYPDTYLFKAQALYGLGRHEEAMKAIEFALDANDGDPNDPLFIETKDKIAGRK